MASSLPKHSSPTRLNTIDDPDRPNSQADPNTIKRNRSVQFSASPSPRSSFKMIHSADNVDIEDDVPPHQQAESSADEITPIVGRERGGSKNYDTTSKLSTSILHGSSQVGTARSRKGSKASTADRQEEAAQDERTGWWRDFIDKYGSVELDNKGSVARDHLALGKLRHSVAIVQADNPVCSPRTHLPRLAPHFPRLCFYWNCRHPIVQTKYHHF